MQIVRHVDQGPTVDISQLHPQSLMGAQEDLDSFIKGDAHRDKTFEVHLLGRSLIVIRSGFGTVRAGPRPKPRDSKLGPGIITWFPRISVGFPGSLDVPRTSQNEPRTGLAIPRTVKGFPGSFSAPRTRPTCPGTI